MLAMDSAVGELLADDGFGYMRFEIGTDGALSEPTQIKMLSNRSNALIADSKMLVGVGDSGLQRQEWPPKSLSKP